MNKRGMITLRWLKRAHARTKGQVEQWNYAAQPEPIHEWVAAGECEVVEWANKPESPKVQAVESAPATRMVYHKPAKAVAPRSVAPKVDSKE